MGRQTLSHFLLHHDDDAAYTRNVVEEIGNEWRGDVVREVGDDNRTVLVIGTVIWTVIWGQTIPVEFSSIPFDHRHVG